MMSEKMPISGNHRADSLIPPRILAAAGLDKTETSILAAVDDEASHAPGVVAWRSRNSSRAHRRAAAFPSFASRRPAKGLELEHNFATPAIFRWILPSQQFVG